MNNHGVYVERGIVQEVCDGGGYKVKSYIRDGIITPEIPAAGGATYEVGDRVYFFLFDDGRGLILAAF